MYVACEEAIVSCQSKVLLSFLSCPGMEVGDGMDHRGLGGWAASVNRWLPPPLLFRGLLTRRNELRMDGWMDGCNETFTYIHLRIWNEKKFLQRERNLISIAWVRKKENFFVQKKNRSCSFSLGLSLAFFRQTINFATKSISAPLKNRWSVGASSSI